MNHELRNRKRATTKPEAKELLERGEYGILSTCGSNGQPYGIPLSYCIINDTVYFHSAVAGRKLENIADNNRVSFCVVGKTEILPKQFTTRYESVIIYGNAMEVFDDEKQKAMVGLQKKYSTGFPNEGMRYIADAWRQIRVFGVKIEAIYGKARR